jgi:5-methylcytosine-specific restriction endonuclease McrA
VFAERCFVSPGMPFVKRFKQVSPMMIESVLQRPTLVLSRHWQPVCIVPVYRSLTKVFQGTARFVDPKDFQEYDWSDWTRLTPSEGEPVIRGSRFEIRCPEVIVLTRFDGQGNRKVSFSRRNVFKRDRYTCQYCGRQPGNDELTIDHVLPRSQGGASSWENCVLACLNCNKVKADRTPEQVPMKLRKRPERPTWRPIYAAHSVRIESWTRFLSEAYWNSELDS